MYQFSSRQHEEKHVLLLCTGQVLVVNSQFLAVRKQKKWRNNRYPRILEFVVRPVSITIGKRSGPMVKIGYSRLEYVRRGNYNTVVPLNKNPPLALKIRQNGKTCFVVLEICDALDKPVMWTIVGINYRT